MVLLLELPSSVPMEARLLFGSSIPSLKQKNKWVVLRNNFSGPQLRSWDLCSHRRINGAMLVRLRRRRVEAMSSILNAKSMNLNEYMITVDKPLGIRFAQTINGTVFVHALKKGVSDQVQCSDIYFLPCSGPLSLMFSFLPFFLFWAHLILTESNFTVPNLSRISSVSSNSLVFEV